MLGSYAVGNALATFLVAGVHRLRKSLRIVAIVYALSRNLEIDHRLDITIKRRKEPDQLDQTRSSITANLKVNAGESVLIYLLVIEKIISVDISY